MNRSEELASKLIDGVADAAESAEFQQLVNNDPEAASEALLLFEIEVALRAGRGNLDVASATMKRLQAMTAEWIRLGVMKAILPRLQAQPARSSALERWRSNERWLALAACLAIFIGLAFLLLRLSSPPTLAILLRKQAEITVERGERVLPCSKGQALLSGDVMNVGAGGEAVIVYKDATRLELGQNSRVTLGRKEEGERRGEEGKTGAPGKWVELQNGILMGEIAKQPRGHPMIFQMPNARATVVGTRLQIAVAGDTTKVNVIEGRVQFAQNGQTGVQELAAGSTAEARGSSGNMQDADAINPGNIVYFQEFETIHPGEETPNALVRLKEKNGDVTVIESVPCETEEGFGKDTPIWKPDVVITLASAQPENNALYTIPEEVGIRIRIKSEKTGNWILTQFPTDLRFELEHFASENLPVDEGWREIVLRGRDIKPYRTHGLSRDFLSGTKIQRFKIFGFGTGKLFVDRFEIISLK